MKMFRNIGVYIGAMACLALARAVDAISYVASYVVAGCRDLASGVEKLGRELTYNANRGDIGAEEVSSGFLRESHGFRQTTASTAPTSFALT